MNAIDILLDGFDRVRQNVHEAVEGLEPAELDVRLDAEANSVAWLIWHLTRVQDDHVAEVAGRDQVWTGAGWHERFGLAIKPGRIGYGDSPADVAEISGRTADQLLGYYDAVHAVTLDYLRTLSEADLDRVVDERWDPPVTLGVRLISVLDDDIQHSGQANFVRGVVERR